jgi:hypothetical protein
MSGYYDESGHDGRLITNDMDVEESSWTSVLTWKDCKPL